MDDEKLYKVECTGCGKKGLPFTENYEHVKNCDPEYKKVPLTEKEIEKVKNLIKKRKQRSIDKLKDAL